jgi:FdrA protein
MLDNDLRIRRLEIEANDPQVAVILIDVVLGFGAHLDPAAELAPAIAKAKDSAQSAGRYLEVVAVVSGTDEDPQDLHAQMKKLTDVGVVAETSNDKAVRYVGQLLSALNPDTSRVPVEAAPPVDLAAINQPLGAINFGLESFTESLAIQNARAIQVDWRPAAGGDERLMDILERMRSKPKQL